MIQENELIKKLQNRERDAYKILIENYSRLLFSVCAGILIDPGTREDVEDAVADCFLQFWENIDNFDPSKGSLKTYLCSMAHSRAVDKLRSICRRKEQPLELIPDCTSDNDNILSDIVSEQSALEIWEYMQTFPCPDNTILTLRFFYELKPADISLKLDLPISAVYQRIRTGRQKLKTFIKEREEKQ